MLGNLFRRNLRDVTLNRMIVTEVRFVGLLRKLVPLRRKDTFAANRLESNAKTTDPMPRRAECPCRRVPIYWNAVNDLFLPCSSFVLTCDYVKTCRNNLHHAASLSSPSKCSPGRG